MKKLLKSKTLWFSVALSALSVAQGYLHLLHLTPERQALVGVSVAAAVALLRVLTTQPLSEK